MDTLVMFAFAVLLFGSIWVLSGWLFRSQTRLPST